MQQYRGQMDSWTVGRVDSGTVGRMDCSDILAIKNVFAYKLTRQFF